MADTHDSSSVTAAESDRGIISTSTPAPNKACPLLSLPPELRNSIYAFAIHKAHENDFALSDLASIRLPIFLLASKQIYTEALKIFWTTNTFTFAVGSNFGHQSAHRDGLPASVPRRQHRSGRPEAGTLGLSDPIMKRLRTSDPRARFRNVNLRIYAHDLIPIIRKAALSHRASVDEETDDDDETDDNEEIDDDEVYTTLHDGLQFRVNIRAIEGRAMAQFIFPQHLRGIWMPMRAGPEKYLAERASMQAVVDGIVTELNDSGEGARGLDIDQLSRIVKAFEFDEENPRPFV